MSALASSYSEEVVVSHVELEALRDDAALTVIEVVERGRYTRVLERMKVSEGEFSTESNSCGQPGGDQWWNL
jgi:hypothetical protein